MNILKFKKNIMGKTIELKENNVLKAYKNGDAQVRKMLTDLVNGQVDFSKKMDVKDRIKTFEDACEEVGINPEEVVLFKEPKNSNERYLNACAKLPVVAKALNEGWEPNWDDGNYKYWPYFDMRAGVGFSYTYCDYWYTHTAVGSRLCFKSSELAKYAGTQFIEIYKDFITL